MFLGIHIDTVAMTTTITPERLTELLGQCNALLTTDQVARRDLRSLFGVMSFVTACIRPARLFMNALLNSIRENPDARVYPELQFMFTQVTERSWEIEATYIYPMIIAKTPGLSFTFGTLPACRSFEAKDNLTSSHCFYRISFCSRVYMYVLGMR